MCIRDSNNPDQSYNELNAFLQLFLVLKKWNLLVGGAYVYRNNTAFSERISSFNPRLAFLYKSSSNLSFRASYSTAFKIPGPYFRETSYTIQENNFETILTGINPIVSERTLSFELGLRWLPSPKVELDMAGFYSRTLDFLTYDILPNPNFRERTLTAGYFNDDNTTATLWGIQSTLWLKDLIPAIGMDARLNINWSRGKESLFPIADQGGNGGILLKETDALRAFPDLIAQAQLSFHPFSDFTVVLDNVLMSNSKTRNTILIREAIREGLDVSTLRTEGYYTLDITTNYRLNRNFRIYARLNNVFNKGYAGIDANGSPDILDYNPQSLFTFRFGVNYNLN